MNTEHHTNYQEREARRNAYLAKIEPALHLHETREEPIQCPLIESHRVRAEGGGSEPRRNGTSSYA